MKRFSSHCPYSPRRSRLHRALSYAFTHAVYAYKLLWPESLSYDWGFRSVQEIRAVYRTFRHATRQVFQEELRE